jgi:hypothetical protein
MRIPRLLCGHLRIAEESVGGRVTPIRRPDHQSAYYRYNPLTNPRTKDSENQFLVIRHIGEERKSSDS